MPISVPVPKEFAQQYDKETPSTYGEEYAVYTGPYMIENDAEGKTIGYEPGKRIHLVRNPNWDASTDYKPAYLDSITIEEGNDDLTVASRRTLSVGVRTACAARVAMCGKARPARRGNAGCRRCPIWTSNAAKTPSRATRCAS